MDTFPVLLVEDNADDERLARRALRSRDSVILRVARDGQEAIDALASSDEPAPALVILDLKLPKIGGIEVLEWIRSCDRLSWLPVVILSSSDELLDRRKCQRLHANSFVQKPIDFDEFIALFQRLVDYWQTIHVSTPPQVREPGRVAC